MAKESWKVVMACLIGAGLGTFTALEFNHYFWWAGLLLGGVAGYLSYEWRKVVSAIPAAWKAAKGFTLPKDFALRMLFGIIVGAGGAVSLVVAATLLQLSLSLVINQRPTLLMPPDLLMVLFVVTLVGAFFGLFVGWLWSFAPNDAYDPEAFSALSTKERGLMALISLPPVWMPLVFFYLLPRYLWKKREAIIAWCEEAAKAAGRQVMKAGAFVKRFAWELFLRIHSEMRILCGVDSFLGAGIGYFTGSVAVGALSGAAFGLVNYLVVTKRWLEPRGYLPLVVAE